MQQHTPEPYEATSTSFDGLYAAASEPGGPASADPSLPAGEALCAGRCLPTFACDRGKGGARTGAKHLPASAASLLSSGMACVLRGSGLFTAGVERWGRAEFLADQLKGESCHTLVAAANRKRFKYWRDEHDASRADRVPGGYTFSPPLEQVYMGMRSFLRRSWAAASTECVYMQQTLLQPTPESGGRLVPATPLGGQMARDLSVNLDADLLGEIASAGAFGPPQRCQLFVGAKAADHARTVLHFDQYDNCFMMLSGRKTFLLFDPTQTGRLHAYPIHHPLDRSAQVDLDEQLDAQLGAFPRAEGIRGCRVTLEPGDVLILPAYWWHEVITEPLTASTGSGAIEGGDSADDDQRLTVSLNFWFTPINRMLRPALPLSPMLRVELARQAEFLISDTFDDRPALVPVFLGALAVLVDGVASVACGAAGEDLRAQDALLWERLRTETRPVGVEAATWVGLLEYMAVTLAHLLGGHQVRAFVHDLLSSVRFARLERERSGR
jgi:hypoxia-inducible factor 1-alpha inhibitor (HIF hydroxylase)